MCICETYLLISGRVTMHRARVAYSKVDSVSSTAEAEGEMFAIMQVRVPPPNESFNSLVKLLSLRRRQTLSNILHATHLKGTWPELSDKA